MTNREYAQEVLRRVRQFEEELKSIGVSVKVDVRGLDAAGHEYEAHEVETCVLCAVYERGIAEGQRKGASDQSDRFEGAMNRVLDRT